MNTVTEKTKVLIIGAGFGGIAAALEFDRARETNLEVTLISNKPYLEYYPALYRVATGRSPLEVCIPLSKILAGRKINPVRNKVSNGVNLVIDEITALDPAARNVSGRSGRKYNYDQAILALGSDIAYFNIPGLQEFSFGFKSIQEAQRLEKHIQALFTACATGELRTAEKVCRLHLVVVGAGPTGVELTGELVGYLKRLAGRHGLGENLVTIDLFDAAERILPTLDKSVSRRAAQRLRAQGVNIFVNRPLVKEEVGQITLGGLTTKTETVIWTAGLKPSGLFQKIPGLAFDPKGRVVVDAYLRAKEQERLWVVGDGAATPFAGLAQTAIHNGRSVARNLIRLAGQKPLQPDQPKKPFHAIPIGHGWGIAIVGPITFYGRLGWLIRRLADLRYLLSILPLRQALAVLRPK